MRRFLTLVCLLCVAIPAGISISGCTRNPAGNYCNGLGYGLTDTQVASIFLTPQTTGMSIAFGQTQQVAAPTAKTCKGTAATVASYTYGTTNNQLVDISPSGNICAGTWNRNTGGGIPNYTICNFPSPLPSTNGLPYGVAYVTASGNSVTSNPVAVYVHPQVTSLNLVGPTTCLSQDVTAPAPLDVQACFVGSGTTPTQQLLCAPPSVTTAANPPLACPLPAGVSLASIPDCTAAIGTLSYNVGTSSVASINQTTNQITAELPGTTVITASVAQGASSAGYFSTCPPASINVTLANGATSGTITQGVAQNLSTTIYDTNGAEITGLTLNYQSTDPFDISVGATGSINTNFPGVASVTAICEPPTCNPAPNNVTGLNGTGLSISSDPVKITTPGTASDYVWFSSPGQSQYFVPVELLTNTVGSTVRLPYVPNSMLMDKIGANIYFGSARELMTYSTTTNALSSQSTAVPGVVLAVAPSNAQVLINDQARHLFYLYTPGSSTATTFGGMGAAAEWTPDSQTLYIFDNAELNTPATCATPLITGHTDTLYVYNVNSGWTYYTLPPSPLPAAAIPGCTTEPNTTPPMPIQTPAITNPGVGAYLAGNPTVAHTWCPETVAPTAAYPAGIEYYPQGDSVNTLTDVLAATTDGMHILGAALNGTAMSISDIGITLPTTTSSSGAITPAACTSASTGTPPNQVVTLSPLNLNGAFTATVPVAGVNATTVNQVVPSPNSALAFLTYSDNATGAPTSATLPYYLTSTPGTNGTVGYVTLAGAAQITAPQVGAFSPDGTLFFVGTAGDNLVHYISIPTTITSTALPTDTQQVAPGLPACIPVSAGGSDAGCVYPGTDTVVPVTAIVVKPRSTT
jgi:trimeric autotransporter adhesin